MQMYLFRTANRYFTSATSTAATPPRSSGTSTRTGCPTAWSSHDDGSGALSSPHAGAMGEAWSDWYALDLLRRRRARGRHAGARRGRHRRTTRTPYSHSTRFEADRLPRSARSTRAARADCDRARRLHVRRLRPDRRRPRGARRRRDLGADAVGPARGGRTRDVAAGADHRGDADVAARAVVPRHAQRDPRGRRRPRRREPRRDLAGVRRARHGLLRRRRATPATSRRTEDFSLPPAPAPRRAIAPAR